MKNITLNDLLDGQPDKQTKELLTKVNNEFNKRITNNPTITSINVYLKSHKLGYISASDTLKAVYHSLSNLEIDSLHDWNIELVSDIEEYLIDLIKELRYETDIIGYERAVIALYDLLDYSDDDFVIYDEDGVSELDFDTLNYALGVD